MLHFCILSSKFYHIYFPTYQLHMQHNGHETVNILRHNRHCSSSHICVPIVPIYIDSSSHQIVCSFLNILNCIATRMCFPNNYQSMHYNIRCIVHTLQNTDYGIVECNYWPSTHLYKVNTARFVYHKFLKNNLRYIDVHICHPNIQYCKMYMTHQIDDM